MIYSLILAAGLASQASAACTRATLEAATEQFLAAVAGGKTTFAALASNASYIENDAPTDITKGFLAAPITIDLNRTLLDTTLCASAVEIVAATSKHPYVILSHLLFTDDKVTTLQNVVTDQGDWAFNVAGSLRYNKAEKWDPIPEAKRDSRDVIKAAGDAYLDSWGNSTIKPPYGAPCNRLEGGSYTGSAGSTANSCTMPQFPGTFHAGNRRYVIDEDIGGLSIFNDFPFIDKVKPDGTSSSNLFRVEGGKIRYIHEATVCTKPNCAK